jgi:hypothetical protein
MIFDETQVAPSFENSTSHFEPVSELCHNNSNAFGLPSYPTCRYGFTKNEVCALIQKGNRSNAITPLK